MRTNNKWDNTIRDKYVNKYFTPRIARDVNNIPVPTDIKPITGSMYMYGEPDCGKTLRVAWMMLETLRRIYLSNQKPDFAFGICSDVFKELRSGYNNDDKPIDLLIERLQNVQTLVLDDIGTVRPNEWVYEILYVILNFRYEYLKTTVITSNYNLDQLSKQFGGDARITSRIKRSGKIVRLEHYKLK